RRLPQPPAARARRARRARGGRAHLPDRPGSGSVPDRRGQAAGRRRAAAGAPGPPVRGTARGAAAGALRAPAPRRDQRRPGALRGRGRDRADVADRPAPPRRPARRQALRARIVGPRRREPPRRRLRWLAHPLASRGSERAGRVKRRSAYASGAMLERARNLTLTPRQYFYVALVALASLSAIVLTGAAVRLTGSGLGCPDWPKCYGNELPPLDSHALIEYGNRIFTGFVGVAVIAASLLAWRRRPFRWHLALFGALLPLGVIGQAVLGGLVVKHHLAPGLVMGHFILSMLLLDAGFALAWCSRYEPGERRRSSDRIGVWAVRSLIPFGQLTVLLGTMTTASGPHAGAHEGQLVQRFDFKGADTLSWMVQ